MMRQFFRRSATAFAMVALVFGQVTWALAGTTGGISGLVTDTSGSPIAGASVRVVSASQSASTASDVSGRFNFLSLAPDTYTVSIEKEGYQPLSYAGITVFADNNLTLSFRIEKALKTIAKVSATSAGSLVKGGVGADIYSVNSQAITSSAVLGGGGNLNSAYSAISSVPGVTVPSGGMGWNQPTYVRGSQAFFTGFEYDGIPVNRAFDNYVSSTESNLGLQELQVYTGGGPSSSASAGTSGFINQVFKTGTYPGYLDLSGGIGAPTYYHQAKVEAGGATPDRRFSYYIGLSGYNQGFRFLDNQNGGLLANGPTSVYTGQSFVAVGPQLINGAARSETPECLSGTSTTPASVANLPWLSPDLGGSTSDCYVPYNGIYGFVPTGPAQIADRENVANFHFRIPQKNGTSDDIQLLGSTSMLNTQFYSSADDAGGYAAYTNALFGNAYCNPSTSVDVNGNGCTPTPYVNYPAYVDATVYNAPFGTPIKGLTPQAYYQPSSPSTRAFQSEIPADTRDALMNDTGVVKLQYTHQFSSNAFARVFGYTFFSDWTQAGANSAQDCYLNGGIGPCQSVVAANYDLITHTGGGQLELVDQLTSQHLVQLTANFTTANVVRFNNTGFTGLASPIGIVSNAGGKFSCWDEQPGTPQYDTVVPCVPSGSAFGLWGSNAIDGAYNAGTLGPNATAAAANWVTLWNGDASGTLNTVKPQFSFVSLSDQWRPNDRWLFNFQARYENYKYGLVTNPGIATDFYAQIVQNDVCQNASGVVLTKPLVPGAPPPAPVIYTPSCAAGTVVPGYPNGIPAGYGHPSFSAASPASYSIADISPRISATYTESPDTVWRGSIGRFTEPPISASLQYLNASGNSLSTWNATLPLGFDSPFHPIPPMSATQADLSLEHHLHGTDMSFKLSPFYNYTVGYQQQSFIGPNFVTQAPVGNFRSMGVEFAFTKGDFGKDGLSTQAAITYTNARVQYTNYFGVNQLNAVNQAIAQYNVLTKAGGGSPYYCSGGKDASGNPSPGVTTPNCGASGGIPITNPYYTMGAQPYLQTNAWYPGADTGLSPTSNPSSTYFDSPWNLSWILNYRKQRLAATFSVQVVQGSSYGGPLDVVGVDPRVCTSNAQTSGITLVSPNTNPFACDALTAGGTFSNAAGELFIPNPQTGTFASPGMYRNPWIAVGNLAFTYDISPRISANVTLANLFHTCFGGTKAPWTSAFPPGTNTCGYEANGLYVSNFYNGTSPFDTAANGFTPPEFQTQSYAPRPFNDAGAVPSPFNVFLQLTVKV